MKSMKSIALIIMILVLASCAGTEKKPIPLVAPIIPLEEQETKSMAKFNQMIEMTENVRRSTVINEIVAGYEEIRFLYPDSYLAEESFYRLIIMHLEDYYPPHIDDAERLYMEYFQKYKKPRLNNAINDYMIRFYYRAHEWEKLVLFCIPYIKKYAEEKVLKYPLYMFFYAEAKFNVGDLDEAERGYKIMINHFPDAYESTVSKDRLKLIDKKR